MRKLTGTLTVLSLLTTTAAALAQSASPTVPASPAQISQIQSLEMKVTPMSAVADDLNALIQANLAEAAVIRAEMKRLGNNHAAQFTWLLMLQDYNYSADRLATAMRAMGMTPNVTRPSVDGLTANYPDVVGNAVKVQEDMLRAVRIVKPKAHGATRDAVAHMQSVIEDHLNLLKSMQKGLPITGA